MTEYCIVSCTSVAVYLWTVLNSFECMVLVREYEEERVRQGSVHDGWRPALHKYKKPRSMEPPPAPDPHLLAQLVVTVGISEVYPLQNAVDEVMCCLFLGSAFQFARAHACGGGMPTCSLCLAHVCCDVFCTETACMQIIGSLLRRCRATLPRSTSLSVCMHLMHAMESVLDMNDKIQAPQTGTVSGAKGWTHGMAGAPSYHVMSVVVFHGLQYDAENADFWLRWACSIFSLLECRLSLNKAYRAEYLFMCVRTTRFVPELFASSVGILSAVPR